jgi:hypothetical protein
MINKKGGVRPGAGRPKLDVTKKTVAIRLWPDTIEQLKARGGLSEQIEAAVDQYLTQPQRQDD